MIVVSIQTAQSLISSEFAKNESKKAAVFDLSAVEDPSLVRYIEKILDVGISGYDDQAVLERVTTQSIFLYYNST